MLTSFFTSGVQHSLSMLSSKAIELRGLIERSLFRNPIPIVCSASFKECNKHVLHINISFHITLFHLDRLTKIELDFAWTISNYYCYAFIQSFFPMDWSIQKELSVFLSITSSLLSEDICKKKRMMHSSFPQGLRSCLALLKYNLHYRNLLQLYHVYGGFICCDNHYDPQLPSSISWHPWDA